MSCIKSQSGVKKKYTKPTISPLGTVEQLTLGNGGSIVDHASYRRGHHGGPGHGGPGHGGPGGPGHGGPGGPGHGGWG